MKGSRPTRDQARGEMTAAAQVHGRPLMQLNQLCRWYLYGFLFCLAGVGFLQVLGSLAALVRPLGYGTIDYLQQTLPLVFGSIYFFGGAIGIRFLPTSLGSSPHLHSLTMGLWSFWLGVIGTVGSAGTITTTTFLYGQPAGPGQGVVSWFLVFGGGCWFVGSLLLAVNFWKTIQTGY